MPALGGSVQDISIDSRGFSVAADADGTRDFGGFATEFEPNGDGTARPIKTRKIWKIEGLTIAIDDDNDDQGFLQGIMDAAKSVPITVTYASGHTVQGSGLPTGDLGTSSATATAAITLSGPGKLTPQ